MRMEQSNRELEGRVNAHRELLIDFMAALFGGQTSIDAFLKRLTNDASYTDHEEDPGVIPNEGVVEQNAAAREIRSILEAARARHAAEKHQSQGV
jgi:cytochrome P450